MTAQRFRKVYIEISNICNLQCSFCPVVERDQQVMSLVDLEKTLREVQPYAERVCFHVMGEPLNHPHFAECVAVANRLGVSLEITTNGTLLVPEIQQVLLGSSLTQINFSLQSFIDNFPKANPETYLQKILSFCDRALAERPDLYLNLRLWNLESRQDNGGLNEFFFRHIENNYGVQLNRTVDPAFRKSKKIQGRLYLHFDSRFEWPTLQQPVRSRRGRCHGTVNHLAIHAEGTVVPCCLDKEARINLGSLKQSSFAELLEGSRLREMQSGFLRGELIEDLCQRCTYIERFD